MQRGKNIIGQEAAERCQCAHESTAATLLNHFFARSNPCSASFISGLRVSAV